MRICQAHWDELKQALEERGLMKLVCGSGEKATRVLMAQAQGDTSNNAYDPLLAANFAIWNNALECFGLGLMATDAPCPLCHLDECAKNGCGDPNCKKVHSSGGDWIRYAADEQLENARERKLVPPVQ